MKPFLGGLGRALKSLLPARWREWARARYDALYCVDSGTVERIGREAAWWMDTARIMPGTVVISGGVGKDVSFELTLVDRFGCRVLLFDPTPIAADTMAHPTNRRRGVEFLALGLAQATGLFRFIPPEKASEGSWAISASATAEDGMLLPCTSVSSFLRERGVGEPIILKLDVEGAEFGVLEDVLRNQVPCAQILVEFHPRTIAGGLRAKWRTIRHLRRAGYRIHHRDREDYLFVPEAGPDREARV